MRYLLILVLLFTVAVTNAQEKLIKTFYLRNATVRLYQTDDSKWMVGAKFKSVSERLPCIISVAFRGKSIKQIDMPVDRVCNEEFMIVTDVSSRKYPNIVKAMCYVIDEQPPKQSFQ